VAASELIDPLRVVRPEVEPLDPLRADILLGPAQEHPHQHPYAFMLDTGLQLLRLAKYGALLAALGRAAERSPCGVKGAGRLAGRQAR
jgi:hypothetical protein